MSFLSRENRQAQYTPVEKQSFYNSAGVSSQEHAQYDGMEQVGCHSRSQGQCRSSRARLWAAAWLLQCLLFLGTIAMLTISLKAAREVNIGAIGTLAPALRYTVQNPGNDYWSNQLYSQPGIESDRAWNQIMNNQSYRITEEDVAMLDIGHLPLNAIREGGYAGILGVFHNLHCLRRFKQALYVDDYPIQKESSKEEFRGHLMHCIETLRTSLMCHPDLTQLPMIYLKNESPPFVVLSGVPQKCADWDAIMEAAESRHYDHNQPLWEGEFQ